MKKYILEPDLVEAGKYYIYEHSENYVRTACVVYYDIDLAKRILKYLQEDK